MANNGNNYCFACGKKNPIGLHLNFEFVDDVLTAKKTLTKEYQGFDNIAHGGIVATLLDEAMGNYIIQKYNEQAVTGRIAVRYHHPTPIGEELTITSKPESQRRNIISMTSKITAADGTVTAEATAKFVVVSLK